MSGTIACCLISYCLIVEGTVQKQPGILNVLAEGPVGMT